MLKRLLASKPAVALGSALAAAYIRLVYATSTIKRDPTDTDAKLFAAHPQILAMWHGQFLLLPKLKPTRPSDVRAMVSRHGDAEIVGSVLTRFGMSLIRGAGAGKRRRDRGGATAVRESLRALAGGATVAMTADVPPGPARKAGEGIATLAALSGRPVVPFAIATRRFMTLPTWSAFTINLPFSTLSIVIGDPVKVAPGNDADTIETARLAVERGLAEVTARAYALAGAVDPLNKTETIKPGLSLGAYRVLTRLAVPLAPLILAWRTRRGKEEPDRRPERYGLASAPRPAGFLAWFHAASVGEANAALPVIETIAAERPEVRMLLTTATVTSARLARTRLPKGVVHQYVPLDNQAYVQRFLRHWRPDLAVLVESEIWPNLVLETKAEGIPLLLINGRMSASSYKRWRRRPGLSRPLFSAFDLVLAQNDSLAERFAQLGVAHTLDVGNLKADAPPPPSDERGQKRLVKALSGRAHGVARRQHPSRRGGPGGGGASQDEALAARSPHHHRAPPSRARAAHRRAAEDRKHLRRAPLGGEAAGARHRYLCGRHDRRAWPVLYAGTGRLYRRLARAAWGPEPGRGDQARRRRAHRSALAELPRFLRGAVEGRRLPPGRGRGKPRRGRALLAERRRGKAMMVRAERAIAAMSGALPRTLTELERFLPPKATFKHAS